MAATALPTLPTITKLSATVTRILASNPGKFTLQGTNTYLIGPPTGPLLLLDTGQGCPEYITSLRLALNIHSTPASTPKDSIPPHNANPPAISDILLTHWHPDHVDGLPSVLTLLSSLESKPSPPPRVWKFPSSASESHRDAEIVRLLTTESPSGSFELPDDGEAVHELTAGQVVKIADGVEVKVLHTPGHTTDSVSVWYEKERVLFTADTVLGHGTAVFEDLSAYMKSLSSCLSHITATSGPTSSSPSITPTHSSSTPSTAFESPNSPPKEHVHIYPGHGEVVSDGVGKLEEYLAHRQQREDQVVEALRFSGASLTALKLTHQIYASTIPPSLVPAAARGLLLHLEKLQKEGKVHRLAPPPSEFSDTSIASSFSAEERKGLGGGNGEGEGGGDQIPKLEGWGDSWSLVGEKAVEGVEERDSRSKM